MSISGVLGDQQTVELPQGTIAYRERGEGPVLLFVHGLFVNGDHWRKVVPLLADRYRCVAPDLPFGAHSHPLRQDADRSAAGLARLVADFIAELGLDDVTVIGNDTGDAFTNFLPWLIKPVRPLAWAPPLFHAILKTFKTRAGQFALLGLIAKNFPEKEILEGYFGPPLRDADVRRDLREIVKGGKPSYTLRAAKKLRELKIPALIVWQRAPNPVFPKFHGRRLAKIIPDARLEIVKGTLAFIPEDRPERLAELIAEFVPAGATVR